MPLNHLFRGWVCAIPLVLAACGGDPTPFDLELIATDCDTESSSVIPNTGTITVTVTGEGMSNVSASASLASRSLALPEVPVGKNRIAIVEVRDATGGPGREGNLHAVGTSAPFEVKESGTPKVTVALYRVNGFTFTRAERGSCSTMETARAGHTATLLEDGRVLIAGGYAMEDGEKRYLSSAEIFDPSTNTFTTVAPSCEGSDCLAVAHARAARLRDGRVLIVGGEEEGVSASERAAIYDPETDSWDLGLALETGRRGHTATLINSTGVVLVVGGVDVDGQVVSTVELFRPGSGAFEIARVADGNPVSLPRAFHGAAPTGIAAVQIAGGIDENGALPRTSMAVNWLQTNDSYNRTEPLNSLAAGSVGAGFVPFEDAYFAVVGGARTWTPEEGAPGLGVASGVAREAQWFEGARGTRRTGVANMARQRFEPCVAPLDETRALVVGGFREPGLQPLADSDLLAFVSKEGAPAEMETAQPVNGGLLKESGGRGHATCTALGDGSVVVIGGLRTDGSVADSAEIYVAQRPQQASP